MHGGRRVVMMSLAVAACTRASDGQPAQDRPAPAPAVAPADGPPPCPVVTESFVRRFVGPARGSPGPVLEGVQLGQPARELPARFAAAGGADWLAERAPIEVHADDAARAGAPARVSIVRRGAPAPQLFALEIELPGTGVAALLAKRWGAPIRLASGGSAWVRDHRSRERWAVTEYGCTSLLVLEPVITVDELLDLGLDRAAFLGAPVAGAQDAGRAWIAEDECLLADGCGGVFALPALPFADRLFVRLARTQPARVTGLEQLRRASRVSDVMIRSSSGPEMPAWLDAVPAETFDAIAAALARRFGAAKPCRPPEPAGRPVHGPLRFERGSIRAILDSTGITLQRTDLSPATWCAP
jgi:hypothetical protein